MVVEIDPDDIRASVGDLLEELEEASGAVRKPYRECQKPERGQAGLEISYPFKLPDDGGVPVIRPCHLEENGVPVDPVVVLDPIDIDLVGPEELGDPMQGSGFVGDAGDERVPCGQVNRLEFDRDPINNKGFFR